ncbi:MAG: hypothetical protein CMF99_05870 [Candidatus Marinimicrobia bacterium]|nr:hypothetical protein [Candidatus Neomarinimicrobiota bacterium]|tara:strand:- start:7348 stop:8106 length:759 start_codon:yes stop_codon:yes gene_type:complete
MKTFRNIFYFVFVITFCNAQLFEDYTVYGGLSGVNITTSDFTNFHVSDWEQFGLDGLEGRVAVPLGDNDIAGPNLNVLVGAYSPLLNRLDGFAEAQVGVGDVSYVAVFLGVDFKVMDGASFSLGLTPKFGYSSAQADFGAIELLPGKTPPVVLSEGTFNVGDSLTMDMSGVALGFGLTPRIQLTDEIGLTSFIGFQQSITADPAIKAGDIEIPMSSNGVVKSDGSSVQAGLEPTANSTGFTWQFGITYDISL